MYMYMYLLLCFNQVFIYFAGYIISVFEVSYVYALLLVCGTTIFLLMFIVVPAILSGVCKEMPTCLFDVPVVVCMCVCVCERERER